MSIALSSDPKTQKSRGFLSEQPGSIAGLEDRADKSETIERLRLELDLQAAIIREQQDMLAHSRKIFDRASAVARIGVWECELADNTLHWTDGVYDIFDMPRGAPLDREETVGFYTEASRRALHEVRSRAIAERTGFELDAEIVTPKGRRRWIRLTATVECEGDVAVRLFGMKQDITDEKNLADRTRYLAEYDVMTGLANRALFQTTLARFETSSTGGRAASALLLVDLDDFKSINDTLGHAAGDDCLKAAADRLRAVCPPAALTARIGGDEFAVLLPSGRRTSASALAARIVEAMAAPVEIGLERVALGASVGVAFSSSTAASDLFARADAALYAAKAAGRGVWRLFEPDATGIEETLLQPNRHRRRTD